MEFLIHRFKAYTNGNSRVCGVWAFGVQSFTYQGYAPLEWIRKEKILESGKRM